MNLSNVGSYGAYSYIRAASIGHRVQPPPPAAVFASSLQNAGSSLDDLKAYFSKPPAERVVENWLSAHHLTKKEFGALPPDRKEALRKEMAADFKRDTESRAKEQARVGLDLLV